jgi:hypothetical protein
MTPSPKEAVAKAGEALAGTHSSAKEYKRESTAARLLGAGKSIASIFPI